jgi:hypothetical protein
MYACMQRTPATFLVPAVAGGGRYEPAAEQAHAVVEGQLRDPCVRACVRARARDRVTV